MSTATLDTTNVRRWKRYPEYRAANLDWQRDVPKHWDVKRLKWTVTTCQNGVWGDEPTGGSDDIACIRVADFDRTRFLVDESRELTVRSVADSQRRGKVLRSGDLLIEKSGGGELQPVGAVVQYTLDRVAVSSNFVARMPVAEGYSAEFLRYLHAAMYTARVNTRSIKQSIGIQNLDSGAYLDEPAGLPPLPEQRAIAAFLDRETARIDALIGHKERLIALLEEKRQAVISHAVTRGLDPSVRLKHFCDILPGFAFPSEGFSREPEDIRLLRGTNVMPGGTDWTDVVRWPQQDRASYSLYELRVGDIVFGMDRPWIKSGIRVARITEEDLPCLLLQRVARLRATQRLTQDYLELLITCGQFTAYFEPILTGVSVPHISPEQILDFRFGLPKVEEQVSVCRRLNSDFKAMTSTAIRIRDGIARLQEYRTALISAAVTGQIDVRGEVELHSEEDPT